MEEMKIFLFCIKIKFHKSRRYTKTNTSFTLTFPTFYYFLFPEELFKGNNLSDIINIYFINKTTEIVFITMVTFSDFSYISESFVLWQFLQMDTFIYHKFLKTHFNMFVWLSSLYIFFRKTYIYIYNANFLYKMLNILNLLKAYKLRLSQIIKY